LRKRVQFIGIIDFDERARSSISHLDRYTLRSGRLTKWRGGGLLLCRGDSEGIGCRRWLSEWSGRWCLLLWLLRDLAKR
jgi:hypothetical protein